MLRVLNDTHIGAERSAGTTVASRLALKEHILFSFENLLPESHDLLILGDLFDKYDTAVQDVLVTFRVLRNWLIRCGHKLYLVAGNHDLSKTSNVLGSFDLLASLLHTLFPEQVTVIKSPTMTPYGYVIPHLPNQDAFNAALAAVPTCNLLMLHCNYDNKFAAKSDQSLNISKEQVEAAPARRVLIAHEHQYKLSGKVFIPGNQIATSVSDWLNCEYKYFTQVDNQGNLNNVSVKATNDEYIEQPWATPEVTNHKFVRLVGTATAEQAPQVVGAVAKFRSVSPAFVVTNAVEIASGDSLAGFADSLETTRAFDVWQALAEALSVEELTTLKALK